MSSSTPDLPPDDVRRAARDAKPIPPPVPAYLSDPAGPSALSVDRKLYDAIRAAPRVLLEDFTVPVRSGRTWKAPAGAVVRISTPEGAQVGQYSFFCSVSCIMAFLFSLTISSLLSLYHLKCSCRPLLP